MFGYGGFGGGRCPHRAGGGGDKSGDSLKTGEAAYYRYSFNSGKNINCHSRKNEGLGYVRIKLMKLATRNNHISRKSNIFYHIFL